ncbi:MAG: ylxRQ [Deltaproteobacteria bacterium]|nr:ylxRQ [Deltaproteobacteria bacterium]
MPKAEPQRSCLGCREVKPKDELLRFVLDPDSLPVPDIAGKLPGRGAYTCFSRQCLENALARKQFSRAFKGEAKTPVAAETIALVQRLFAERIAATLALANKAGRAVSGSDTVMESLRRGDAALLILAADIAAESEAKFRFVAEKNRVEIFRFSVKDQLGTPLGKEIRTAVAVSPGAFADKLCRELTRYWNFF